MSFPCRDVLDRRDGTQSTQTSKLDTAELQPELPGLGFRQSNRCHRCVLIIGGLLNEAYDITVIHFGEMEVIGLEKRRILISDEIQASNIILDVSLLVPIPCP